MKHERIAIVGRMAKGAELLDGQTVKTKVLCEELRRCFPDTEQVWVDTYQYRKHALPILRETFRAFATCDHIFVLLSRNGRKFFFPLLTGLNCIFRRRLYHDVVGGALPGEAAKSPALRRQLRRFEVNWVEFEQMKAELEAIGISNVEVLPNFKRLNMLSPEEVSTGHQAPFVFSMFSRVTKEKGMTAYEVLIHWWAQDRVGRTMKKKGRAERESPPPVNDTDREMEEWFERRLNQSFSG